MKQINNLPLNPDEAALWLIGQAGCIVRCAGKTVVIDPYLSDSCARELPAMARVIPVPLNPAELKVDVFIVTHDHTDHLDPDTVAAYRHKADTLFVGPHLACRKLAFLGVPADNIRRISAGETEVADGVTITGVYAIPNAPDAVDTAGYFLQFGNGRSLYHTGDTDFSTLLLACAPGAEVLVTCINGKWGNLNPQEAAKLAAHIRPRFAIPNHYDVMAVNSENPEAFVFFLRLEAPDLEARVLEAMKPFVWGEAGERCI